MAFQKKFTEVYSSIRTCSRITTDPLHLLPEEDSDDPNKMVIGLKKEMIKKTGLGGAVSGAAMEKANGKHLLDSQLQPVTLVKNTGNHNDIPKGRGKNFVHGNVQDVAKTGREYNYHDAPRQPYPSSSSNGIHAGKNKLPPDQVLILCELTLPEYEKLMKERENKLPTKETTGVGRIVPSNEFASKTQLPSGKESDEIFFKLDTSKNGGRQKWGQERGRNGHCRGNFVGSQVALDDVKGGRKHRGFFQSVTKTVPSKEADLPPLKYSKQ